MDQVKKRILFLHPNFPGQFKHVAKFFAENGHEVVFLCQTHYNRSIENVNLITLKGKLGIKELNSLNLGAKDRAFKMSAQYLEAFKQLTLKKWTPEVIISHSAWGCGAYAKQFWPKAHVISYVEWWFDIHSSAYTFDKDNKELGLTRSIGLLSHWPRNALIALELVSADKLVSPTNWQKKQLPKKFQDNCRVIFDGIDTTKFLTRKDNHKTNNNNFKITYGTRGMEPMRAFPQFIRSIPLLVEIMPDITIEIAGNDEMNYGASKPKEGTWKKWALKYLESHNCLKNVKWTGRLGEDDYIVWLQTSDCHVYLTHPFVASWSLIEAIFACKKIVASDVEPVREFYEPSKMVLIDHRNINSIKEGIISQLNTTSNTKTLTKSDSLKIDTCLSCWNAVAGCDVSTID